MNGNEPYWKLEYSVRGIYDSNGEWPTNNPLNATFWHRFTNLKSQSNIEFSQLYNIECPPNVPNVPNVPNYANGSVISQN